MTADTTTITDFILARAVEDEAVARRVLAMNSPSARLDAIASDRVAVVLDGSRGAFDPARVLAQCAAYRRIVEEAYENAANIDGEWGCCHSADAIRSGACEYMEMDRDPFLRALAGIWSSHPEYREDWA